MGKLTTNCNSGQCLDDSWEKDHVLNGRTHYFYGNHHVACGKREVTVEITLFEWEHQLYMAMFSSYVSLQKVHYVKQMDT